MNVNNTPLAVFDNAVVEFLGELSADLLKSPLIRIYPDIAAFAFYIRKANLLKLKDGLFPNGTEGRVGRGLCFHVAPGNIPVNFAFTWVFGLLAGNANIVRLPSKPFPQVDAVLDVINHRLSQNAGLAERNQFVRYPRTDTDRTAAYCAMADARMIWGGDKTIASVKAFPTSPRCVDIAFADRYSLAIIDGQAILDAGDTVLARLAESFYNDTWLMDQNACSSPQLICWENDSPVARRRFWNSVLEVVRKRYLVQDAVAVDKYTQLCEEAVTNPNFKSAARTGNWLYREELSALTPDVVNRRGKAGYFFEYAMRNRCDLFAVVTPKFQTITYFGIQASELRDQIAVAHVRGIDRIVPIGKAMDIGVVWDGTDLIRGLSRIIAS